MNEPAAPVVAGVMQGAPLSSAASESIASSLPALAPVSSKPASGPPAALSAGASRHTV